MLAGNESADDFFRLGFLAGRDLGLRGGCVPDVDHVLVVRYGEKNLIGPDRRSIWASS